MLYDALDPLLVEAFRRQPPDVPALQALRRAMHEVWGALSPAGEADELERGRLVYTEPGLRARYLDELLRTAQLMATLAAERLGRPADDFEIRVATGALMGAGLGAMLPLVAGDRPIRLIEAMDRAIDLLEAGLRF